MRTDLPPPDPAGISVERAAQQPVDEVLAALTSTPDGLSVAEAADRLRRMGPNAVRSHHARPLAVLARQFKSALLVLLLTTASISFFLGERTDAAIIGAIVAASVGLGFANEYRAERAAEALHSQVKHHVAVLRDAHVTDVDVIDLVPGDIVRLSLGEIVPADVRLIETVGLQCDESVLTGESLPVEKDVGPCLPGWRWPS